MFFYKTDQKLISGMRCHLCSITSEMIKFTTSKLFVFCNFSVSAYLLENKNDKLLDLFFGKMTPFLPCNLFTVHFFFFFIIFPFQDSTFSSSGAHFCCFSVLWVSFPVSQLFFFVRKNKCKLCKIYILICLYTPYTRPRISG